MSGICLPTPGALCRFLKKYIILKMYIILSKYRIQHVSPSLLFLFFSCSLIAIFCLMVCDASRCRIIDSKRLHFPLQYFEFCLRTIIRRPLFLFSTYTLHLHFILFSFKFSADAAATTYSISNRFEYEKIAYCCWVLY